MILEVPTGDLRSFGPFLDWSVSGLQVYSCEGISLRELHVYLFESKRKDPIKKKRIPHYAIHVWGVLHSIPGKDRLVSLTFEILHAERQLVEWAVPNIETDEGEAVTFSGKSVYRPAEPFDVAFESEMAPIMRIKVSVRDEV
jgi:hypothetical protein